ncbi:YSIRK-type signal peptide-containing protein [Limosilactobacillus fermentum]|nr:YSIRK-type signal peptide-containing protein [Limosilactobacillus fermentum]UOG13553.1 YSIRK-type signal peptide-containing protein [Limosilactobacillus fermentum]
MADRHLKEKITIMVGKNNQNLLEQKMGQRYTRWSIRRLSIGVVSVAVASGAFLFSSVALGPTAHAATNPEEVGRSARQPAPPVGKPMPRLRWLPGKAKPPLLPAPPVMQPAKLAQPQPKPVPQVTPAPLVTQPVPVPLALCLLAGPSVGC